jgi:hypothetical protein
VGVGVDGLHCYDFDTLYPTRKKPNRIKGLQSYAQVSDRVMHSSTAAQQHSSTAAQQHSSTAAQQHSSTG